MEFHSEAVAVEFLSEAVVTTNKKKVEIIRMPITVHSSNRQLLQLENTVARLLVMIMVIQSQTHRLKDRILLLILGTVMGHPLVRTAVIQEVMEEGTVIINLLTAITVVTEKRRKGNRVRR